MSRQDDIFSECSLAYFLNRDPVAAEAIESLDSNEVADICVKYRDNPEEIGRKVLTLMREAVENAIEADDSVEYDDVEQADRKERALDMAAI